MAAKGLWIPIEILSRRDLRLYDKIVLALVQYLDGYGGIPREHVRDWAATLGVDQPWLDSELRRLRSLGLVNDDSGAWRAGASKADPRAKLPDLPPGVEASFVMGGVAWVETENGLARYKAPSMSNNGAQ